MSSKYKNSSSAEYTRVYENLRGVDLSIVPNRKSHSRFAYLENMYVDYEGADTAVESVVGFRKVVQLNTKINGMFLQRLGEGEEYVVVHAGTKVYRFNSNNRDTIKRIAATYNGLIDTVSRAVCFKDSLYIMDGEKILVIAADGSAKLLGEDIAPYIPILSQDGEENENANLLTSSCICKYTVNNLNETGYASPGLTYEISNEYSKTCKVTGISNDFSGELHIPSYVFIEGKKYNVTAIGESAFKGNAKITALHTNANLKIIEKYAFRGCPALKTVHFSDTVSELGHYSFYSCTALTDLYIGLGFTSFGVHAMDGCTALQNVYYAGSDEEFIEIERVDQMINADIHSGVSEKGLILSIPVSSKISSVQRVFIGNTQVSFIFEKEKAQIRITIADKTAVSPGEVLVYANADNNVFTAITPKEAITYCTLAAVYDGRLFLSGNPSLPGYVFYSSTDGDGNINPAYFSVSDFFIDGGDKYGVCSLLATDDGLVVFKAGDGGEGDVFYHKPSTSGGYPVTRLCHDSYAAGDSFVFLGDTVFVSEKGLSALESSSGKMRAVCRSGNINRLLLCENPKDIRIAEWQGYIVLSVGGRMYLGDSRATFKRADSFEYEWYYLSGIGTYFDAQRICRYSSVARDGYEVHENVDQPTDMTVVSKSDGAGGYYYYVTDSKTNKKYEVYLTDEFSGGVFKAATSILGFDNLLYFGTESGDVCIFNNDKRGVAPDRLKNADDFDPEEYKRLYGRKIHPDFYGFDNKAAHCVVSTVMDDCELPGLRKNSIRDSLAVKFKTFPRSMASVFVSTDAVAHKLLTTLSVSEFNFADVYFADISMLTAPFVSRPIPEFERDWVEKSITLSSDNFRAPIGIYSISYRYRIKGKIKKN
ncbi:MAG: leucine-rich repeat domain-containing protein [Ruminococcaceae bacterium]|nr:leucine-rich repeat domain-containing protein [Oscillospiraceae bacterium]